jgi:hypothetical protein
MRITCLILLALFITSCEKSSIKTYHIPKQIINVASLKTSPLLVWKFPNNWRIKENTQFRIESRSIKDKKTNSETDFSITKFPDNAGNLLANINRWRTQLSLSTINETEIINSLEKINHNFLNITLIKFKSNTKLINNAYFKSTYVSFFKHNGFTFYIKLTGESKHLTTLNNEYLEILKTITYDEN